jgi:hypothetical protein
VLQIAGVFKTAHEAVACEQVFQRITDAIADPRYLNKNHMGWFDPADPDVRAKIVKSLIGKKLSAEHRAAITATLQGNTRRMGTTTSDEGRRNISLGKLGIRPSQETKDRMRAAHAGRVYQNVTCPHCGTTGGENVMPRWHFVNCKHAPA